MSGKLTYASTSSPALVGGPSQFVLLLPMMEYGSLYDNVNTTYVLKAGNINTVAGFMFSLTTDLNFQPLMNLRDTLIPELTCPSNPNALYLNQTATSAGSRIALTNYKAMGATNMVSLAYCLKNSAFVTPPYPSTTTIPLNRSQHPDGACFPGVSNRVADFTDGTAHTILCTETMDYAGSGANLVSASSAWFAGQCCTLVGVPSNNSGTQILYVGANQAQPNTMVFPYISPSGFNGKYDADGSLQSLRTYLAYDFAVTDTGLYPDPTTTKVTGVCTITTAAPGTFGPSAGHPSVVNHLFADGAVHRLEKTSTSPCTSLP